jgi:hypothetical protein
MTTNNFRKTKKTKERREGAAPRRKRGTADTGEPAVWQSDDAPRNVWSGSRQPIDRRMLELMCEAVERHGLGLPDPRMTWSALRVGIEVGRSLADTLPDVDDQGPHR